jgi:uncharacterized protein
VSRPLGLLLAPGAGAGRDQSSLVAIDEVATAAGTTVERMDFPYRRAGRRAPDRAPVLVASVIEEARALAEVAGPVAVGGRSMGGRICSMAAAPEPGAAGFAAAAVVLISYPLHPPGRPDKRRIDHFPYLAVPCLFVSGTRDAFATPAELEAATATIPGLVSHVWIDGGDHGLRGRDRRVAEIVSDWLGRIFPNYWRPPSLGADAAAG